MSLYTSKALTAAVAVACSLNLSVLRKTFIKQLRLQLQLRSLNLKIFNCEAMAAASQFKLKLSVLRKILENFS